PTDATRMTAKALTARAEAWRPWRAYAVMQLWKDSMGEGKSKTVANGPSQEITDVIPAKAGTR
ncbi:MAG: hypothetical protein ABWX93_09395, partial [Pseudoxanthomonas sp.]